MTFNPFEPFNPYAVGAPSLLHPYDQAVLDDVPKFFYFLDEASGIVAEDSGVVGSDGEYIPNSSGAWNGGTFGNTGPFAGASAAHFNGSTGRVSLPAAAAEISGAPAVTVEFFARYDTLPSGAHNAVIVYRIDGSSSGIQVYNAGNVIRVLGRPDISDPARVASSDPISTATWYHVACVIDFANNEILVYLDGSLSGSNSTDWGSSTYSPGSPDAPYIGGNSAGTLYFDGRIARIAVYDKKISPTRIAAHAAAAGF